MQLSLFNESKSGYKDKLVDLLSRNLDFHEYESSYASHDFHAFPAKFPPQLPKKIMMELTNPKEIVLDPMVGSGTTLLEAYLSGRYGVGIDIDTLALKICKAKVTSIKNHQIFEYGKKILHQAWFAVTYNNKQIRDAIEKTFDFKTMEFINKWFAKETQIELFALRDEIQKIKHPEIRNFFEVVFSSIIITKSGGVSLAYDLAHTRPHLAKAVVKKDGEIIYLGNNIHKAPMRRVKLLTKPLRSALEEFKKRFQQNLKNLTKTDSSLLKPVIIKADAQHLPLADSSVDLIITSPPYASNAIDYLRSHKFSLVWLDSDIETLCKKRKYYIGGETIQGMIQEKLPAYTEEVVAEISKLDPRKGRALHRYYSEMTRILKEMFRVLKPGKAAIVVVGSSIMRGRDTEIHSCLANIGKVIGFEVPKIGIRNLDRNRRMLPVGSSINMESQIQKRMHKEYIIGFYKR